ncbi:GTP-binding protein [Klebsiella pneumoniae]|uniref:GTP-binding protein n=1 Tax=Klebsiella pneumoniae TaxID=573 RepID=UPI00265CF01B|nr:GTP-binding protein [Klebsiella pneumoniae]
MENEFGEICIDDALVINADEEVFEMNNGCICCTVRGDLIHILSRLMYCRDKFDCILIETTGMANLLSEANEERAANDPEWFS